MSDTIENTDSGLEVSVESIQVQKDTRIVGELIKIFTDMKERISVDKLYAYEAMDDREIRVLCAKLDKSIKKRFGINIRTIYDEVLLGIVTTPATNGSILARDIKETIKEINNCMPNAAGDIDPEHLDRNGVSMWGPVTAFVNSVRHVDEAFGASGMTIDLKRAKVHGYPDKAFCVLSIDPVTLLEDAGLSPIELTACVLHEIGHAFTHLEYTYRLITNTTHLAEDILEASRSDEPLVDVLKLSYGAMNQDKKKSDTPNNVVSLCIGTLTGAVSEMGRAGGNVSGLKDSERSADLFASRFGLGESIVTALDKISAHEKEYGRQLVKSAGTAVLFLAILMAILSLLVPWLLVVVATVFAELAIIAGVFAVIEFIINPLVSKGIDESNPYDTDKRRVLRLKNEAVRYLRTSSLDKSERESVLATIDVMVASSEHLDDNEDPVMYRLVSSLFSSSRNKKEMRKIDNDLDDLMNNDLHVMSNRIALIGD